MLKTAKTIAVVGLSDNPMRVSYDVSEYMQSQGYRIVPVNPTIAESLGEKAYPTLSEVPEKIDIVNVFRRPQFVPEVVEEAIRLKVPAIWLARRRGTRSGGAEGAGRGNFCGDGPVHLEGALEKARERVTRKDAGKSRLRDAINLIDLVILSGYSSLRSGASQAGTNTPL